MNGPFLFTWRTQFGTPGWIHNTDPSYRGHGTKPTAETGHVLPPDVKGAMVVTSCIAETDIGNLFPGRVFSNSRFSFQLFSA